VLRYRNTEVKLAMRLDWPSARGERTQAERPAHDREVPWKYPISMTFALLLLSARKAR
jgi:hypothetical protein